MERRSFLKASAALGAAAAVTGCDSSSSDTNVDVVPPTTVTPSKENIDWSSCTCNCAAACALKVISSDNVVTRIETDDTGDDNFATGNQQARACLRGRSSRQKIYAFNRLKYPVKQMGERGNRKTFMRITWEEAYTEIASEMARIYGTYGAKSVYWQYASGTNQFRAGGRESSKRLLNLMGGYLKQHGTYSAAQLSAIAGYTWGNGSTSTYDQMQHSDLIVSFGFNPAETRMSGTGGSYDWSIYTEGKEVIVIDPRYSESAVGRNVTWYAIRPGTDAALIEGLAHYWISNNLVDEAFLAKYCVGYDATTLPAGAPSNGDYKSYILGQGDDGIEKTTKRAAEITGISEVKIIELAQRLAEAQRPFITQGWGVQRQANGEQSVRAIYMVPILLGKLGIAGTNNGNWPNQISAVSLGILPEGNNAVKEVIPCFMWTEAIVNGKNMSAVEHGVKNTDETGLLGADMKLIWNYAGNTLMNQHSDCFKTAEILRDKTKCEFILVHDVQPTASADFADILLPDVMDLEQHDIVVNAGANMSTVIAMTSSVKPVNDVRSCFEVCKGVAAKLGIEQEFTEGRSYQEWVEYIYETSRSKNPALPAYKDMVAKGIHKIAKAGTTIALEAFIKDPVANPLLAVPSGKIEIYSQPLQDIADKWILPADGKDVISALPKYVVTFDGYEDEDTRYDYPLQMIGHHTKGRTHSSFHSIPWLREAVEDAVWMNPMDAEARGLSHGDAIKVYNARGTLLSKVKVTPRIMPGVCSLPQGAWFDPSNGIDVGGCINTITSHRPSSFAKGNPQHTNRVEIVKA